MSVFRSFLSLLGLALAEDLRAGKALAIKLTEALRRSEGTVASLMQELREAKSALSASEKERADLKRTKERQNWCSPHLVEFPAETSTEFRTNTQRCLRAFLSKDSLFSDLTNPAQFPIPAQWALYWCLAHASHAATTAAIAAKNEDGISRVFLDTLDSQAKMASAFPEGGKLQIAYNAIFEQSEPAMKEAAVGADILLIVAGQALIPNGLARIFWLQAKKAHSANAPYSLRFDQQNKQGLQIDALSNVSAPARGSFGLYMQYSEELPYLPAVDVRFLSRDDRKSAADLSSMGIRLPELLVAYTRDFTDVGAFRNTDDLRAYLDEVSEMKPLFIVTATAGGLEYQRGLAPNYLLAEISAYYREKLGLTKKRQKKQESSYELDM